MYLMGKGQSPLGPGTATVQMIDWTRTQERQIAGLGCACQQKPGLGLFESLDPRTWGWQEISIAVLGAYTLISVFSTTSRAARSVSRYRGERRERKEKKARTRKRAATLRRELEELGETRGFWDGVRS
jgi:hypothetical protein